MILFEANEWNEIYKLRLLWNVHYESFPLNVVRTPCMFSCYLLVRWWKLLFVKSTPLSTYSIFQATEVWHKYLVLVMMRRDVHCEYPNNRRVSRFKILLLSLNMLIKNYIIFCCCWTTIARFCFVTVSIKWSIKLFFRLCELTNIMWKRNEE